MDVPSIYKSTCNRAPSTILKILILNLLSCTELACGQSIITPPDNEVRIVGETAKFHCLVEFGPIPTVAWEFNDAIIYSMETKGENYPAGNKKYLVTHDEGNFTLWVKDVDLKDGGTYTCSAMIPSASATLVVLDTPQISMPRHDVVEGQAAEYTCVGQFSGPSKEKIPSGQYPQLQIFFAGMPLKGIVEEGNCTGSANCFEITLVMTWVLEASDNGKEMMCKIGISSSLVYLNSSTEMKVLYAVRNVAYTPKREQYGVGTQINCTADANPVPAFTWDDRDTGNSVDGQTLEISEQMLGNNTWKCTARNSIGEIQHQKSVTVVFEAGSSKIGVGLGVSVPVCVIVILLTTFYCKKYKKNKKYFPANSHKDAAEIENKSYKAQAAQKRSMYKPVVKQIEQNLINHGTAANLEETVNRQVNK